MRRFVIFAAIAFTALYLWHLATSETVRYQLSLYGEVDGKPFVGSVVNEVTYSGGLPILPNEAQFTVKVDGQAAEVNVGDRGTLFALLRRGSDHRSAVEYVVLKAFNSPGGAFPSPVSAGLQFVRSLSGKVEVPLMNLPLLVRFRDTRDPMSVEQVNPSNLAGSFGSGASLKSATLEIVPRGFWPLRLVGISGRPLTSTIHKTLPWLSTLTGSGYLNGGISSIGAPLGLQAYDFVRG